VTQAAGFTKIELSIGLALAIPLLFGVLSLTHSFTRADERARVAASAKGQLQDTFDRIQRVLTSASWASLRVPATDDGGDATRWTYPRGRVVTDAIRFESVVDDMPVEGSGESLTLRFVPDPDEKVDGEDNDSDGFVDEGRVQFEFGHNTARAVELAQEVEACSFVVADGVVTITMKVAVRNLTGEIERAGHRRSVWLRNP
jgi:hypothetical protein